MVLITVPEVLLVLSIHKIQVKSLLLLSSCSSNDQSQCLYTKVVKILLFESFIDSLFPDISRDLGRGNKMFDPFRQGPPFPWSSSDGLMSFSSLSLKLENSRWVTCYMVLAINVCSMVFWNVLSPFLVSNLTLNLLDLGQGQNGSFQSKGREPKLKG